MSKGRLIVLAGLSCVGKSPLEKALARFYPELRVPLQPVVMYNDRDPRPGEVDGVHYHFRDRATIEALGAGSDCVAMDVRGDLQALDVTALRELLRQGDAFFEGNPFVGQELMTNPQLQGVAKLGIFMAPLCRAELLELRAVGGSFSLPALVTDVMRRKLLRRTRKQKNELSLKDLQNIEARAGSAYTELKMAHQFDAVIANHDGEDSENWDAFYYPLGDARKSLLSFVALLRGESPAGVEKWEQDLLP